MKEAEPTTAELTERAVRSEAWIDAFEAQATRELIGQARRYAEKHVRILARAGVRLEALDLVHAVLGDTLAGILSWDPDRASLVAHVIQSLHGRARDMREKAQRYRHQSMDSVNTIRHLDDAAIEQAERSEREQESQALAAGLLAELKAFASGDPDVLSLLDAYADDAFTPKAVMKSTNLSKKRYRNAKLRLDRMVDRLGIGPERVQA
jgi:hypothetical protein